MQMRDTTLPSLINPMFRLTKGITSSLQSIQDTQSPSSKCLCAGFGVVLRQVMDHHNVEGCTCSLVVTRVHQVPAAAMVQDLQGK